MGCSASKRETHADGPELPSPPQAQHVTAEELTRYNDIGSIEAFAAEGDVGFVFASHFLELAARARGPVERT